MRLRRIVPSMLTVVETLLFQRQWPLYWTEEERGEFAAYIAESPDAGDVVPESGGIRKVRWRRAGTGKAGGVRVIYFTRTAEGIRGAASGQGRKQKGRAQERGLDRGNPREHQNRALIFAISLLFLEFPRPVSCS